MPFPIPVNHTDASAFINDCVARRGQNLLSGMTFEFTPDRCIISADSLEKIRELQTALGTHTCPVMKTFTFIYYSPYSVLDDKAKAYGYHPGTTGLAGRSNPNPGY